MNDDRIPDWRLPAGVDRGLWEYMRSAEMVAGYEEQMAASPLAAADVAFCEAKFPTPGRLLDMGCGTGRLCRRFAAKGYDCVGVDLSDEMLATARAACGSATFVNSNLAELNELDGPFDYAACLFSTLGMVRGGDLRRRVISNAFRLLKPGGWFVLHVHNRNFLGLGWKNWRKRDLTMPQAYAGAPLTLHHFSRGEATGLIREAGFEALDIRAVNVNGGPAGWPTSLRAYGYLLAARKAG